MGTIGVEREERDGVPPSTASKGTEAEPAAEKDGCAFAPHNPDSQLPFL